MNLNQTLILKDNRTLGYAEAGNPTGKPQLPPTGIKIESSENYGKIIQLK